MDIDDDVISDSDAGESTQGNAFEINGRTVARDSLVTLRVLGKGETCVVTEVRSARLCLLLCPALRTGRSKGRLST